MLNDHPCFSETAHDLYYRLHLPVALKCNLGCNYCSRKIGESACANYRPGVTNEIFSVNEAVDTVSYLINQNGDLKVVGIAGPGEPLFNKETFETFEKISKKFPKLITCVSTNGLLVKDTIQRLIDTGIHSISVTINSMEIENIQKIYRYVIDNKGVILRGIEAAHYIREKQEEALDVLDQRKVIYKVNSIYIPEINTMEMLNIAFKILKAGAILHNIVPLIPNGEFKEMRKPTEGEIANVRNNCGLIINQFSKCKQCSSDCYDIPGTKNKNTCI